MATKRERGEVVSPDVRAVRDLAENGWTRYKPRMVEGEVQLVMVEIGFTVVAQPCEDFKAFKQRMLALAARLEALQHRVLRMALCRREAQGKRPWCEFDCATPEAGLPEQ